MNTEVDIVPIVKANRLASEEDKLPEEEVFGQMKWGFHL